MTIQRVKYFLPAKQDYNKGHPGRARLLSKNWAVSSAVERFSDKEEANGSTPLLPTNFLQFLRN